MVRPAPSEHGHEHELERDSASTSTRTRQMLGFLISQGRAQDWDPVARQEAKKAWKRGGKEEEKKVLRAALEGEILDTSPLASLASRRIPRRLGVCP